MTGAGPDGSGAVFGLALLAGFCAGWVAVAVNRRRFASWRRERRLVRALRRELRQRERAARRRRMTVLDVHVERGLSPRRRSW